MKYYKDSLLLIICLFHRHENMGSVYFFTSHLFYLLFAKIYQSDLRSKFNLPKLYNLRYHLSHYIPPNSKDLVL